MSLPDGARLASMRILPAFLGFVAAITVVLASCGDDDDAPTATTTVASTPEPTESPTPEAELLPTQPPGLTTRFLDPEEVTPSSVPPAEYDAYTQLVDELVAHVRAFWEDWFASQEELSWADPQIVARAAGTPIECDHVDVQFVRGSFYCPVDNYVVFEENRQLLPLYQQLGPYAVAMVISHEFGHAVQRSYGISYVGSDEQELQADCFAGVWFRAYQSDGGFEDPEEPILQAYAAARTVTNGRELRDRFQALTAGYLDGIEPCLELVPDEGEESEPAQPEEPSD